MVLPGRDGVPSPSAAGGGTPALPGRPNPATGRPSIIACKFHAKFTVADPVASFIAISHLSICREVCCEKTQLDAPRSQCSQVQKDYHF